MFSAMKRPTNFVLLALHNSAAIVDYFLTFRLILDLYTTKRLNYVLRNSPFCVCFLLTEFARFL